MKIFRRWAGLLLACLMLFAAAVPAHAEEGFNFQWDGGRDDDSDQPHCKSIFMMNLDTGGGLYFEPGRAAAYGLHDKNYDLHHCL